MSEVIKWSELTPNQHLTAERICLAALRAYGCEVE